MRNIGTVTAGEWAAGIDGEGRLVRLTLGGAEVLRAVYGVVRDERWGTVPGEVTLQEAAVEDDEFRVMFDASHRDGQIDFGWRGEIAGQPDGTVRYSMTGEARSDFRKNRIGLVALHPLAWAGRECVLLHSDGSESPSQYPRQVSPHQPFVDLAGIRQRLPDGRIVEIRFAGDVFETEDQRNWSDTSFKTYSTPLLLPFPVELHRGDRVEQSVTVHVEPAPSATSSSAVSRRSGAQSRSTPERDRPTRVTFDAATRMPWPAIGVGLTPRGGGIGAAGDDLHALAPRHLRVDVWASPAGLAGVDELEDAASTTIPVELAVHLSAQVSSALDELASVLRSSRVELSALIVYDADAASTSEASVRAIRRRLGELISGVPIGVGTDDHFAELNRNAVLPARLGTDFVTFDLTPQVHDPASESIMGTFSALGDMVESAESISGGAAVAVGPISLKPRRGIFGVDRPADPLVRGVETVDARQPDPFAAAWAAGTVIALAEAGVERLTIAELAGPRGLVPDGPHGAADRYPIFGALSQLCSPRERLARVGDGDDRVAACALVVPGGIRVGVANLTDAAQTIEIAGLGESVTAMLAAYDVRAIEVPAASPPL